MRRHGVAGGYAKVGNMIWLILGLVLWSAAHFFKRVLPRQRAAMGNAGRAMVTILVVAGVILMVIGYRATDYVSLFYLPQWAWYLNNVLMLAAIFLMDAGRAHGVVAAKLRHPMLLGVIVWAVSHLMVNGDFASLVLFGGLGLWAVVEMAVINHAEGPWSPPAKGPILNDAKLAVIAIVLYAAIVGVHYWLGFSVLAVLE
jgi:uncharacterized membrane protein